jgi:hypothetical protein
MIAESVHTACVRATISFHQHGQSIMYQPRESGWGCCSFARDGTHVSDARRVRGGTAACPCRRGPYPDCHPAVPRPRQAECVAESVRKRASPVGAKRTLTSPRPHPAAGPGSLRRARGKPLAPAFSLPRGAVAQPAPLGPHVTEATPRRGQGSLRRARGKPLAPAFSLPRGAVAQPAPLLVYAQPPPSPPTPYSPPARRACPLGHRTPPRAAPRR